MRLGNNQFSLLSSYGCHDSVCHVSRVHASSSVGICHSMLAPICRECVSGESSLDVSGADDADTNTSRAKFNAKGVKVSLKGMFRGRICAILL